MARSKKRAVELPAASPNWELSPAIASRYGYPQQPGLVALYLACARLGAIAVAVNTRFRSSEIADILGRSGARLLVLWPDFRHIDFLTILTEADPFALDRLEGTVIFGSAASPELVKGKRTVLYQALN